MARLIVILGDEIRGIPEIPLDGLDVALGTDGPAWGPCGSIDAPRLRLCHDEEQTLVLRRLDGAPPVTVDGKVWSGSRLSSGARVEMGGLRMWLWAPCPSSQALSEDDLRTLFALTRDLSLVDFDELMARMMDGLMEVFGAERGFILLRNRRTGTFEQAIARRIPDSEMGDAASRTVVRRALAEGAPITLGDAGNELVNAASIQSEGIRSVVAAPLPGRDTPIGVVYLDSTAATKVFARRDLGLLDAFTCHVSEAIETALERDELKRDIQWLRVLQESEVRREHDFRTIIGESAAIRAVLDQVRDVGREDVTTLILGESGTGKELVARAIHHASPRRDGPFVAINCMALARDVVESELFGHEKGAFTGASERRIGRFELASGGTVFLDEIGELAPDVQVKLLRVLEERQFERVGGNTPVDLDIRLVAATNKSLKSAVAEGRLREDLYYRLNVFSITLPPLRDRPEDIPLLANHFIARNNERMGRSFTGCSPEATQALVAYSWPGNIRELRNVFERAFILERGTEITPSSLPADITGTEAAPTLSHAFPPGTSLADATEAFALHFIQRVLDRNGGNVAKTAKELGVPRSTIYRKFHNAGVDVKKPPS